MSPLAQTPLRRPDPESFGNYIDGQRLPAVLALIEVESYEDAITKANDSEYGLSAAIATRNPSLMHAFARDIEAGTVKINRTTAGNLINAPFGGAKRFSTSTFRESGRVELEFYTQIKTIYRGT